MNSCSTTRTLLIAAMLSLVAGTATATVHQTNASTLSNFSMGAVANESIRDVDADARAIRSIPTANASLTLASNGMPETLVPDVTALGWVYCRRMLERCDNGDQVACELFERNCTPN
jgi:hypothetical protein